MGEEGEEVTVVMVDLGMEPRLADMELPQAAMEVAVATVEVAEWIWITNEI